MCFKTIWLRKRQLEVPCGRCYQCVKRRRNDWYFRCRVESMVNKYTYFGLLTYAETDMTLNVRDIQLFIKRLRHKAKLKYLIAGEYGDQKNRPHWHCIFFSPEKINYNDIKNAWKGGYENDDNKNKAGWIRFELIRSTASLRYVVKYLYKYDGTDKKFELLMSKNPTIGHSFLNNQSYFLETKKTSVTLDNRITVIPRYYKRKFFDDYDDIKDEINSKLADKVAELKQKELYELHLLNPNCSLPELENILFKLNSFKDEQFKRISGRSPKKIC